MVGRLGEGGADVQPDPSLKAEAERAEGRIPGEALERTLEEQEDFMVATERRSERGELAAGPRRT